jgi:uncharacterized membrane protein
LEAAGSVVGDLVEVVSAVDRSAEAVASAEAGLAGDGEMNAKEFLEKIDEPAVLAAVRETERGTSGEVRVFVSRRRLRGHDVTKRAHKEFHRLDMDTTDDRNAVLFYVVPRERKFAVIGDEAVHAKCGEGFWQETAKMLEADFAEGRFTEGLVKGIRRAGELLARHFPKTAGNRNELPDQIARD